jgi:hypothetical protein
MKPIGTILMRVQGGMKQIAILPEILYFQSGSC